MIDSEGVIVANSVLNEEVTMPAIELLTETRFATGQEILKRGVIDQIVKIGDLYSRQGLPKIKHFKINKDFKQLDLVTSEFQIYISLDYSLQAQIDNLLLTLEKVGDKVQSVEYIDLRIKNRAYVCCYLEGFE